MVSRKFKRHGKLVFDPIELKKTVNESVDKRVKRNLKENILEMQLGEEDKIISVHKHDNSREIHEVTSVSYSVKIREEWVTIVYYDSYHDQVLHRHTTNSYQDRSDVVTTDGVRRRGSQRKLLTWANKDLRENYVVYKEKFLKRSKIVE